MGDYKIEIVLVIMVAMIALFFSWLSGRSKGEVAKDVFGSVVAIITIILVLTVIGWVVFAGWRK